MAGRLLLPPSPAGSSAAGERAQCQGGLWECGGKNGGCECVRWGLGEPIDRSTAPAGRLSLWCAVRQGPWWSAPAPDDARRPRMIPSPTAAEATTRGAQKSRPPQPPTHSRVRIQDWAARAAGGVPRGSSLRRRPDASPPPSTRRGGGRCGRTRRPARAAWPQPNRPGDAPHKIDGRMQQSCGPTTAGRRAWPRLLPGRASSGAPPQQPPLLLSGARALLLSAASCSALGFFWMPLRKALNVTAGGRVGSTGGLWVLWGQA